MILIILCVYRGFERWSGNYFLYLYNHSSYGVWCHQGQTVLSDAILLFTSIWFLYFKVRAYIMLCLKLYYIILSILVYVLTYIHGNPLKIQPLNFLLIITFHTLRKLKTWLLTFVCLLLQGISKHEWTFIK